MISIIVPVYNVVDFLEECLESILSQNYENFELILINDGSNDGSENICKRYALKDNRIHLINKSNGGEASARNLGIKMAKGEYIAFIDSDDVVHKAYLYEMYSAIKHTDSDIVICSYKEFNNINKEELSKNQATQIIPKTQKDFIEGLFSSTVYMATWGKLYRASLLKKVHFINRKIALDVEFNTRIYLKAKKFCSLNSKLYYWRNRPASITRVPFSLNNVNAIDCYFKAFLDIPENNYLYQSFALQRLYKVILYTRYNKTKNLKQAFKNKIEPIVKVSLNKFIKNNYIKFNFKIIILLFLYIPFLYSLYRYLEELNFKINENRLLSK